MYEMLKGEVFFVENDLSKSLYGLSDEPRDLEDLGFSALIGQSRSPPLKDRNAQLPLAFHPMPICIEYKPP